MIHENEKSRRKPAKDPNVYPPGWNRQRVERIIDYYDRRKDQVVLRRSGVSPAKEMVWMEIPEGLVPKVQKLIAGRRKSA
ncbi:MAG: hypothetical protein ABSD28_12090 [Tepidisphaeraceae bacterium]|jgi:hypothetical protein